jgi:hypothetical protein
MELARIHMDDTAHASDGLKLLIESERYKPGIGFSCKAKDVGLDTYAECLEEDSRRCPFSMSYADAYYCISPARVYVAKAVKK